MTGKTAPLHISEPHPHRGEGSSGASSLASSSQTDSSLTAHGVYCEVKFGNRSVRTSVTQPNTSPSWNATVTFEVDPSVIQPGSSKNPSCSRCCAVVALYVRSSALLGSVQSDFPVGYLRVPLTAHQPAGWTPISVPIRASGHIYMQVKRTQGSDGATSSDGEELTLDRPPPRIVDEFPVERFAELYQADVRFAGSAIGLCGPLSDERYLSRRPKVAMMSHLDYDNQVRTALWAGHLIVTNLRIIFIPGTSVRSSDEQKRNIVHICLWNVKYMRTIAKGFNVMLAISQRDGHERCFSLQQETLEKKSSLLDSRSSRTMRDDWTFQTTDTMVFKNEPRTYHGNASLWCLWLQQEVYFRNAERFYPSFFADSHYSTIEQQNAPAMIPSSKRSRRRLQRDLKRMGIPGRLWRLTESNEDFQCCHTYPQDLVIPGHLDDEFLVRAAAQRSKNRFAALSWLHPRTGAPLCRCSQPLMGMASREMKDDETMLHGILRATAAYSRRWSNQPLHSPSKGRHQSASRLIVVDARPQVTAFANAAAGRGYESLDFLNHSKWGIEGSGKVELHFMNVENIHAMRASYEAVVAAAGNAHDGNPRFEFGGALASSGWLQHLGMILRTSCFVANQINTGNAVVVHCSDGWDRTAQITSLVELFCDSWYRTIPGFLLLVEREWCAFGFQFELRGGAGTPLSEAAPIFLQFLDCVHQVIEQFPTHFEFSTYFLVAIADALYSGCFFNNIGNCARVRTQQEEHVLASQKSRVGVPTSGGGRRNLKPYVDVSSFLITAAYRPGNEALRNGAFDALTLDKQIGAAPLLPFTDVGCLKLWETWFFRGSVVDWQRHCLGRVDFLLNQSQLVAAAKGLITTDEGRAEGSTCTFDKGSTNQSRMRAAKVLQQWFWRGPSNWSTAPRNDDDESTVEDMDVYSSSATAAVATLRSDGAQRFDGESSSDPSGGADADISTTAYSNDTALESTEATETISPIGHFFTIFGTAGTDIANATVATAGAVSGAVTTATGVGGVKPEPVSAP
jgi:hypothetical protein